MYMKRGTVTAIPELVPEDTIAINSGIAVTVPLFLREILHFRK